jgi:hypothetical protein
MAMISGVASNIGQFVVFRSVFEQFLWYSLPGNFFLDKFNKKHLREDGRFLFRGDFRIGQLRPLQICKKFAKITVGTVG